MIILRLLYRLLIPPARRLWCAYCQHPITDTAFIPNHTCKMGNCPRCRRWTPITTTPY